MLHNGDVFEHKDRKFRFEIEPDALMGEPWKEHDGHGIVSDWTARDKRPGELILAGNWRATLKRYYDVNATLEIARRDGWGLADVEMAKLAETLGRAPTQREVTARAVELDYEYCRSWANDEWYWCGVVVIPLCEHCGNPDKSKTDSVWGVESFSTEYLEELARELADNIIAADTNEDDDNA